MLDFADPSLGPSVAAGPGGAGTVQQRRPCGGYAIPFTLDRAGREEVQVWDSKEKAPITDIGASRRGWAVGDGEGYIARLQFNLTPRGLFLVV